MSRGSLLFASYTILVLLPFTVISQTQNTEDPFVTCTPSCGNINISYPFRLNTDHQNCGNKRFELSCEANSTTAVLYLSSGKYYVKSINYNNFTIRVVNAGVLKNNNYYPDPVYSLTTDNFTRADSYYAISSQYISMEPVPVIFVTCASPMNSTLFIETAPCLTYSSKYSYFMVGSVTSFDLGRSCEITQILLTLPSSNKNMMSCEGICDEIVHGFELSWFTFGCGKCRIDQVCNTPDDIINEFEPKHILCRGASGGSGERWYDPIKNKLSGKLFIYNSKFHVQLLLNAPVYYALLQAAKLLFGLPCITALLIYKWRRRHFSMYDNIEDFLKNNNNLMPVRYSYSDIKKMTRDFKDKLGEGGYGTVYKATLRSGRLVAIKMLGKSKANGQDFINEVATIGRIHHVNVVQLIGFCVDGSKRALVYDFMPNGSLDKYIFLQQGVILSFKKMFEIALGMARGIDYLHRGCDMQILHFDIKPHNILLDENFTPKVSDFGLARLYPLDNSIVSLTAARGTIGYMAPELFYKNIGGVSYKADVYSFGMLLMEMAGGRKNLNAGIEHSSQFSENYFPSWVSNQLNEGKDIEIGDANEDEKKIIKKMIVVALWCIQMKPSERPSMTKVVEMLEGELESLQIPLKPFLNPQQMPAEDIGDTSSTMGGSTMTESTEIE